MTHSTTSRCVNFDMCQNKGLTNFTFSTHPHSKIKAPQSTTTDSKFGACLFSVNELLTRGHTIAT